MKTILLLFLFISYNLLSQEFSFPLYFEDAKGNKDTITLGYDINATDGIDASFGEENINIIPWDSILDVRVGYLFRDYRFLTKKQILNKDCNKAVYPHYATIPIKSKNYPVKISWNKDLFNNSCRNKTILTDWSPGGWFDVINGSEKIYHLNQIDTAIFTSTTEKYKDGNDSIGILFLAFANYDDFALNNKVEKQNQIWFNSFVDDFLKIDTDLSFLFLEIYDISGKLILQSASRNISLVNLTSGMYIIKITCENNILIEKFLKQ